MMPNTSVWLDFRRLFIDIFTEKQKTNRKKRADLISHIMITTLDLSTDTRYLRIFRITFVQLGCLLSFFSIFENKSETSLLLRNTRSICICGLKVIIIIIQIQFTGMFGFYAKITSNLAKMPKRKPANSALINERFQQRKKRELSESVSLECHFENLIARFI